ncbi:endolysin [Mycobacterium phage Aminay]|uniref:Tape measure protein n=1 Tax=Mycobacterium phage Aminay TaxID=2250291 RepID=A0A345KV05_9CAUD|nr:endolysin [Mycobacterium phage Aminay]AXH46857.1 tape measure protein [Mycobacterium phage Aminay]
MAGVYYLTILPETSKLVPGIKRELSSAERGLTITPTINTRGAKDAGRSAGRDVQQGIESSGGADVGRMIRTDGARSAGQRAGDEVNAGLQSADIGRGVSGQLESNLASGARAAGSRVGGLLMTGLKATAAVGGTVVAAGVTGAIASGMKRLTAIDDAKFKLQGLGNDTQKVQAIMDNALVAVKGTAFGLDEAATTAASAVAAGIDPGEKLTNYLKLTADTAAIAGTSLADMGSIFNKVQTSGKAFTGDLNMLSDRGLPVFQWLQEEYKVSGEELSKMVSDGKVDAATFQRVVAERIGGASAKMGGSVRGTLSNLKASYSRFGAELSGPLFAAVMPLAQSMTAVFDSVTAQIKPVLADITAKVTPWAQQMGDKITAWFKGGGLERIVGWFGRLRDSIANLTAGGGDATMDRLSTAAQGLGPALKDAGPALQSIGSGLGAFGQAIAAVGPQTISAIMVPAMNLLGSALRFVADNASWAVPMIVGLGGAFLVLRAGAQTLGPMVALWNNIMGAVRTPLILAQTAAIRQQAAAMTQLSVTLGTNTVAQNMNTTAQSAGAAATIRGRIASMGAAIAMRAQAVATRAVTAAQWLLNAALTANPIGIVIAAVVAVGAALWAFFTKTKVGRELWSKLWAGIKAVAMPVWAWIKDTLGKIWEQLKPSFQALGAAAKQIFGSIGTAIRTVWTAIQPAIAAVGRFYKAFLATELKVALAVLKGIGAAIGAVVRFIAPAIPVIARFAQAFIVGGFQTAGVILKALGATIGWLWQNVAMPAFSAIGTGISTMWAGAKIVWDAFTTAVQWVGDKVQWLWTAVAVPAFEAIKGAALGFWDGVKGVWDMFTGALQTVGDKLGGFKDNLVTAFNTIKDTVLGVWNSIKDIWDKFTNVGGTILKTVIDTVTPGAATGGQVLAGYAGGGQIRGPGTGTSDSLLGLPAMVKVSNGEFIVNAAATSRYLPLLQALNAGQLALPGYADGGLVSAEQLVDFAKGVEGQPYKWAGTNWGDCSGAVSAIANYATGRDPFSSRFATATEAAELEARGFKPGIGPAGSLSIGWFNGGPYGGHTAATLPDGTNFEMGGARGNGQFGGSAAGAADSQFTNQMHLPPEWFSGMDGVGGSTIGGSTGAGGSSAGGGGGSYRSATSAELSSSSSKVDSAKTAAKNADQSVADHEYSVKKAQDRLDEAKAKGKGVEDAQHSLDKATRELADAREAQAKKQQKLTDAEAADKELRTKGKYEKGKAGSSSKSGGLSGEDFGKTFVSGMLESIGLDGSLFSNPLEWPSVKSAMAGINFFGGLLSGKGSEDGTDAGTAGAASPGGFAAGAADAVGLGGLLSVLPSPSDMAGATGTDAAGWTAQSGSPVLAPGQYNPATVGVNSVASPAGPADVLSAFAPHGPLPGPANAQGGPVDNSININNPQGDVPPAWRDQVRSEQNQRTRTTKVNG